MIYIHPLTYNYSALAAAVLNEKLTVDDAISKFSPATDKRQDTTDYSIVPKMIEMKKSMSYKAVGKHFGLNADAVYRRIQRYQLKFGSTAVSGMG